VSATVGKRTGVVDGCSGGFRTVGHVWATEQRGLSGSRISNVLKPLNGVLNLALRRGLIAENPLRLLTPDERPRVLRRERFVWSPDAVNALLDAAGVLASKPDSKYDYGPLLLTAVYTGMRQSELLGLRWCDVDLKEGAIQVRLQWTRTGELAEPKTPGALRRIPIAGDLVARLAELKLVSVYARSSDFVFASRVGSPLNHRNVAKRGLEEALVGARLNESHPKITFHDLRHAFASIMIERGISSTVLADVMGHRDSRTTETIYVHLFNRQRTDDQVRAAMQSAMRL
jgi:integrase